MFSEKHDTATDFDSFSLAMDLATAKQGSWPDLCFVRREVLFDCLSGFGSVGTRSTSQIRLSVSHGCGFPVPVVSLIFGGFTI